MSAKSELQNFCDTKLLLATEEQVANLAAGAPDKPDLNDFNVGTTFCLDGVNYAVPNPPTATRAKFNELRSAWQTEEGAATEAQP